MTFTDAYGRKDSWNIDSIKNCVGPGWGDSLDRLVADLLSLGWDGELHQVKEKFGGLCFYIGGGSGNIFARIDQAGDESLRTCEKCGAPGKIWPGWYWWLTHCEACNQQRWEKEKGHLRDGGDCSTYAAWIEKLGLAAYLTGLKEVKS